ncbi:MAG: inositol monophosphatase [Myxococcota bacterium]
MSIEDALSLAREAVEKAGDIALDHFRRGVEVRAKADASVVTDADLAAEKAILDLIEDRDPGVNILAEESGIHDRGHARRWIVDPIDGTRGFTRGGELWGPLVALEEGGEIIVGAMALPVRGEIYWAARGKGAFKNGQPLRVSDVRTWSQATLSLGEATRLLRPPHREGVLALSDGAVSTRGLGDLAGVTMVVNGWAEAWIEAGVKPWDLAPSRILVEEAGGRWTTFAGDTDLTRGTAIGSNGHVHDHVLAAMGG